MNEIYQHLTLPYQDAALVALIVITVLVSSIASVRLRWREAAWPQRLLLPALLLAAFDTFTRYHGEGAAPHLFSAFGWLIWQLAIAAHYWLLRLHEPTADIEAEEKKLSRHYFALLHTATLLFIAAIGATERGWEEAVRTSSTATLRSRRRYLSLDFNRPNVFSGAFRRSCCSTGRV